LFFGLFVGEQITKLVNYFTELEHVRTCLVTPAVGFVVIIRIIIILVSIRRKWNLSVSRKETPQPLNSMLSTIKPVFRLSRISLVTEVCSAE
jgi:hypothetical protein